MNFDLMCIYFDLLFFKFISIILLLTRLRIRVNQFSNITAQEVYILCTQRLSKLLLYFEKHLNLILFVLGKTQKITCSLLPSLDFFFTLLQNKLPPLFPIYLNLSQDSYISLCLSSRLSSALRIIFIKQLWQGYLIFLLNYLMYLLYLFTSL